MEYRGKDVATGKTYYSVVRSCSQGTCRPKLSFNCTEKLLVNPGCMIRHCCNEADLCNGCRSTATLWDYQLPLLALAVNVFVHAHWNIISWWWWGLELPALAVGSVVNDQYPNGDREYSGRPAKTAQRPLYDVHATNRSTVLGSASQSKVLSVTVGLCVLGSSGSAI